MSDPETRDNIGVTTRKYMSIISTCTCRSTTRPIGHTHPVRAHSCVRLVAVAAVAADVALRLYS